MDAELDESSIDDVDQCEYTMQLGKLAADVQNVLHGRIAEIFRPLGLETRLIVLSLKRANSIALYFICMSLSALMSLRDQWSTGTLRHIVQSLFTLQSGVIRKVRVNRLTWPLSDYERILGFCSSEQGKKMTTIL